MLITALNKTLLVTALLFSLFASAPVAFAHGNDGGLDFDETALLYTSIMQAMDEAGAATQVILTELERRYALDGAAPSEAATIEFLNERITLESPAFSKLIDRSIDVFRQRLERECSECYHEKRVISSKAFHTKVFHFFKNYFIHYVKLLHTGMTNPRSIGPATVKLTAVSVRLFAIHGPIYLVYTAVTEAIESTVMGPAHWACTFFQALYFPMAVLGHHLWNPMISSGHGFSMLKRLQVSKKSLYMIAKYKWQMRKLFVESARGTHRRVMNRSDYKNYIAGIDHHIEAELSYDKFWAEIYRNFHAVSQAHVPNYHGADMSLSRDLEKIFSYENAYAKNVSEAERFYVAVKQADGLNLTHSLLVKLTNEMYSQGKYDAGTYLRVSWLLGQAGAHIKRYEKLLITGALSPRDNIAVQVHQSTMAELALQSIQKFFKDAQLLVKTERMDQETIRWVTSEIRAELKTEAQRLKTSVRKRKRFDQADADRCRAYLALVT